MTLMICVLGFHVGFKWMTASVRFLTNPDHVATEKISATAVPDAYLDSPPVVCSPIAPESSLSNMNSDHVLTRSGHWTISSMEAVVT